MKLSITRKTLLEALNLVKPAAAAKASLPILSHVALRTFEKSVELLTTDLNFALRAKADCDVATKGELTVSCAKLHAIATKLTGDEVELALVKDTLVITAGSSEYKLPILPFGDFPPLATFKGADEFSLSQSHLRRMLAVTSFCASTDEARYVLNATLLHLKEGKLTAVATDGRRLAIMANDVETDAKKPYELLLPTFATKELLRLLTDNAESSAQVRVTIAENQVRFQLDDTILVSKLVEGNYPNYRQVIPTETRAGIGVNRADLLSALERAAIIAGENSCSFDFRKETLKLTTLNKAGESYLESVDVSPVGTPLQIAFNGEYIAEALQVLQDDEVFLHFIDGVSPAIIQPHGKSYHRGWKYVVMPMRSSDTPPAAADTSAAAAGTKAGGAATAATQTGAAKAADAAAATTTTATTVEPAPKPAKPAAKGKKEAPVVDVKAKAEPVTA